MIGFKQIRFMALLAATLFCAGPSSLTGLAEKPKDEKTVQAQIVLTVSESKRLIAKAVARMPIVKHALKNGMVIIAKGTTNTYVAEELLGRKIAHGAYVLGRTYPEKAGKKLQPVEDIKELVLVKGKLRDDVWRMPTINNMAKERTGYPTQKPEKLLAKLILASTKRGGLVFDPFMGAGSSVVTAKKLDRNFLGVEIDTGYCLLAAKRLGMAELDGTIQGYRDGVFWERNTLKTQKKTKK